MQTEEKRESSSIKSTSLQMIENFGDLFEKFMISEEPIPFLVKLNASWQQILIMLNEEQRKNKKLCSMSIKLFMAKLKLIYTKKNKTSEETKEERRKNIYYIAYEQMCNNLFMMAFLVDGDGFNFNIDDFNESLLCLIDKKIKSLSITKQIEDQNQKIKYLQEHYELQLQQYLDEQSRSH